MTAAATVERERYPFALACVAAAAAAVAAVDVVLALTPLVLFAVAVAASAARGGTRPGLLAAGLAALVSNYLFIAPRYQLSFDWEVARFVVLYLVSVPLARLATAKLRRARAGRAAPPSEVLPLASLGVLAPVLVATCALVAVAVPLLMSTTGHRPPVPTIALGAAGFVAAAALWRRRGR